MGSNRLSGSKSTLFLMEQLIVILVFAVCAAVCVKIFVVSFILVSDSSDMRNALRIAESGAECYKAMSGSITETMALLCGDIGSTSAYYDENWQLCEEATAVYTLKIMDKTDETGESADNIPKSLLFGDIWVGKITGEEIIVLTVAARRFVR